jgi:hypothetical protein
MRLGFFLIPLVFVTFAAAQQSSNFPVGPQYLITTNSPDLLRPIETPTLFLEAPLPLVPSLPQIGPRVAGVPYVSNPALEGQPDLFPIFYGYPRPNVVEIVSPKQPLDLPASITDVGIANVPSASVLDDSQINRAAANSAVSKSAPSRVYSNADIERLSGAAGLP